MNFIKCSVPEVEYQASIFHLNNPINIDMCTMMKKSTMKWYPNNVGLPSIEFFGIFQNEGRPATWLYNDEAARDADYERLLS